MMLLCFTSLIRTKLFSEVLAMKNFLKYFDQMELDFYETDLEALTWAKVISTTILSLPQPSKEMVSYDIMVSKVYCY